jgi:hypothetical protein
MHFNDWHRVRLSKSHVGNATASFEKGTPAMKTTVILSCCAAMTCLTLLSPQSCRADDFAVTDDWSIEITPAAKVPLTYGQAVAAADDADASVNSINPADYQRIYRAIPYNRAEYIGNPTYRHDSAMEILTGNARHQTIVRHDNTRVRAGAAPRVRRPIVPIRYNNNVDRWGLNYFSFYPYWNYRGLY